jgi:ABC-type molybdenum transport system ATPase subunit/photorepair protein PhrA
VSAAHKLEVSIRGRQGSGKSTLAEAIMAAAHGLGYGVDLKQEGYFVGGTWRQSDKRPRVLIEEVQTTPSVQETPLHRRWRDHSAARHVAILALLVLAVMAVVTGGH